MEPMNRLYLAIALALGLLLATGAFAVQHGATGEASEEAAASQASRAQAAADSARAADSLHALNDPSRLAVQKLPVLPPEKVDTETLWLARAIYSETKRPSEQVLVGWVVRNRVETTYRGNRSYRDAVLDPYQFSAFNPESPHRQLLLALGPHSQAPGWQRTLRIAYAVRAAPGQYRPFSIKTRHFYSERSMTGAAHPYWVVQNKLVALKESLQVDQRRFRFYEDIS